MTLRTSSSRRSADLQSAVSPICNRQAPQSFRWVGTARPDAGYKPAIQQIENLRYRAFTLIEVMLAVAIFAIVLAAINGVFYSALRLRRRASEAIEQSLPVQQAAAIIKRDLQGLVAPGGTLTGPLQSGVAITSSSGNSSSMGQQGETVIYTATGIIDETSPWANVQKVSYSLRQPMLQTTRGGKDLFRLVTRNLLPVAQEEVEEQWLLGDVQQLRFYFYDGTGWRSTWDSTTENTVLPKAIKLEIDLAQNDTTLQAPLELVVPVTVYARTNQTQNTGAQQ